MAVTVAALLTTLIATALAADQTPPTAFALTQQYRPDTKWRSCRSTGNVRTNCGFCYGLGDVFLGWNCACDTFVSDAACSRLSSYADCLVLWNFLPMLLHSGIGSQRIRRRNMPAVTAIA